MKKIGKPRRIRTIAGLQRSFDTRNRLTKRLSNTPYVLRPALAKYMAHFERLRSIEDPEKRYAAFREIPSLEHELILIDKKLTPKERFSLAQRERARHSRTRVLPGGKSINEYILHLIDCYPKTIKAKELWAPFIALLQKIGLAPVLSSKPGSPPTERLEYGLPGHRRALGLRQFHNRVSMLRTQRRSKRKN